jgi:hypothetical protein
MYGWKTLDSLVGSEERMMITSSSSTSPSASGSTLECGSYSYRPTASVAGRSSNRSLLGIFMGHTCAPETPGTSRVCKQEPGECPRDYISRFSKQCNSLPDVVDADAVSIFLSRTTCKSLVNKLGCWKPRTSRELLDITMNHTSSEEAVGAVFTDGQAKGKAKREDQDEGPSSGQGKGRRTGTVPTPTWSR